MIFILFILVLIILAPNFCYFVAILLGKRLSHHLFGIY